MKLKDNNFGQSGRKYGPLILFDIGPSRTTSDGNIHVDKPRYSTRNEEVISKNHILTFGVMIIFEIIVKVKRQNGQFNVITYRPYHLNWWIFSHWLRVKVARNVLKLSEKGKVLLSNISVYNWRWMTVSSLTCDRILSP